MIDIQTLSIILASFSFIMAASYYMLTLRNQTKTRHMQIIQGVISRFTPSNFNWGFLELTWQDYDDFLEKYGPTSNSEMWDSISLWFDAFELYGVYVREGMLDVRLICLTHGGTYLNSWEKYGPIFQEYRIRNDEPRYWIEAEYVYERMKKYFSQHPELHINL